MDRAGPRASAEGTSSDEAGRLVVDSGVLGSKRASAEHTH
jgi:hypothetical protein